jgi:transcriptional regulator with XRE-family HTH domain
MSFEEFGAEMKARLAAKQKTDPAAQRHFDFEESYRIRAKMLGVLLRDARLSANRSVEDCAQLLHIDPTMVESWEYGEAAPSLPQLELLAYYLNVPISHFWSTETLTDKSPLRQERQPEYIKLRSRIIGALLQQARQEADLTLEQLSETSGLSIEQLERYESGEVSPPMHQLAVLAGHLNKSATYFLESESQIGELLALREMWQHFSELPEEVRQFAADPINIGFIHIAIMLSKMPADQLREVGASILDITM